MTEIRTTNTIGESVDTSSDVQRHLADLERQALRDDLLKKPASGDESAEKMVELAKLREELQHLRARMTLIKEQTRRAGKAHAEWLDTSAHEQLGNHPWLKLSGAMAGTFLVARMLRGVPIFTLLLPLLLPRGPRRR
ncbi:hypothetical protein [Oryzifoliimicrobium ureilyticus]|uniref:hypothetical protein n=1 Tax=Oryzifoliimicrobium ureilyticus TaxID=3113724 RepID=UPI0030764353